MIKKFLARYAFVLTLLLPQCAHGANTVWNTGDKNTAISIGSWAGQSSLYAEQSSSAGNFRSVRATNPISSGLKYAEITPVYCSASNLQGIANSSQVLTNYLGSSSNSIGVKKDGTVLGVSSNGITGMNCGVPLGIALDMTHSKVWFTADNGSHWNGSTTSTQNPATNTGGLAIPTGNMYLGWTGEYASSVVDGAILNVGNFGPFAYTIPSGFSGWDASGTTLTNTNSTGTLVANGSGPYGGNSGTSSSITLSGGNLTATTSKSSNYQTTVGDWNAFAKSTGKWYYEVNFTSLATNPSGPGGSLVGVAGLLLNRTLPGGANDYLGADVFGFGIATSNNNNWFYQDTTTGNTPCTWNASTTPYVGFAVDMGAALMWCTADGSNWKPSGSPSAGTGGRSLSTNTTLYGIVPGISMEGSASATSSATVNFGASAFHFTLPTGFCDWDNLSCAATGATFSLPMMGMGK